MNNIGRLITEPSHTTNSRLAAAGAFNARRESGRFWSHNETTFDTADDETKPLSGNIRIALWTARVRPKGSAQGGPNLDRTLYRRGRRSAHSSTERQRLIVSRRACRVGSPTLPQQG